MQKRRVQLEKVTDVLDKVSKKHLGGEVEAFKFQKKDIAYREKINVIEDENHVIKDKYDELEARFVTALEGFEKYAYLEERKAVRNGRQCFQDDEIPSS